MRELTDLILTLLIAGVLIRGLDFIGRNLDEALNDSTDQLTNGEGLASAGECRPASENRAEGGTSGIGGRADRVTLTQQRTGPQSHYRTGGK